MDLKRNLNEVLENAQEILNEQNIKQDEFTL